MSIYTGRGDEGETTGPGGRRMAKSDPALDAMGSLDELNSHIGLCLSACDGGQCAVRDALEPLQGELLALGAVLTDGAKARFDAGVVQRMEDGIDDAWAKAGELASFILPGGCELAARLHVARTVCRRAERALAVWSDSGKEVPPVVRKYMNRLGDLLFALARLANHVSDVPEVRWSGPRE